MSTCATHFVERETAKHVLKYVWRFNDIIILSFLVAWLEDVCLIQSIIISTTPIFIVKIHSRLRHVSVL
jgi:hypothetical protein